MSGLYLPPSESVVSCARTLPIHGNLRNIVVELALIFDENPDKEFIEMSDRDLAARCYIGLRTMENAKPQLSCCFQMRGSRGEATTRYERPQLDQLRAPATSAEASAKIAEAPSLSSPHIPKTINRARAEPPQVSPMCPTLDELLTPELLE